MCVFWEGGRGDAQGPPATLQLTSKGCGWGGKSWGAPASVPPTFPGRGRFLWPFGGGGWGGVLVIFTRSWKINLFPIMLWQLLPHPSSSSEWG